MARVAAANVNLKEPNMARWRLLNPHYLNVPGTEWEYIEVSRQTGKQARVRYPVPRYLNPNDPADHNYPGEIIVAHAKPIEATQGTSRVSITGGSKNHDIIFTGPPTSDMEPLDDEAQAISDECSSGWHRPFDELQTNGYGDSSQSLLSKLDTELTEAIRRVGMPQAVPNTSVKQEDFAKLQSQVEALTKQNAELLAKISKPAAEIKK
jgi:hypothetical protein